MAHEANYGWTVQAVTAMEVCRFERGPFFELVRLTPELEGRLLEELWTELEAAREHVLLLAHKGAEEKIASFVILLASRLDSRGLVAVPMTRGDIADYLGLETGTVSRTPRGLRRRGVIASPNTIWPPCSAVGCSSLLRRGVEGGCPPNSPLGGRPDPLPGNAPPDTG